MPEWKRCVKIHEDCGGLVRWVEAVNTPGVGYVGECLECRRDRLSIEDIIPLKMRREDVPLEDRDTLAGLEWDHDASFADNQRRLSEEVA